MRLPTITAMLALGACQAAPLPPKAPPPAAPPPSVEEVMSQAGDAIYKPIPADDLLVMTLGNGRQVTIQLASRFAPVHVANVRALARGGWWNGAAVYRVVEGFVVQWGRNEEDKPLPAGVVAAPPAEYALPLPESAVVPLGYADPYASFAGFVDGWPVSYDKASGTAALAHCYAAVGAGRDIKDTGMGGELYAIIGQAPRRLDRNLAVVGRVIDGFDALSSLPRETVEPMGVYADRKKDMPIARVLLASDMPEATRPRWEALDTGHPLFPALIRARAWTTNDFYKVPAGAVDLCGMRLPVRKAGEKK